MALAFAGLHRARRASALALRAPRPDAGRARNGRGRHRRALREHRGDDAALPPHIARARPRDRGPRRRLALVTAVRWDSQEIAGIGIVGSLLAPVLVGAGTSTSSLVFMTIALLAAIGVVVCRRWGWLAVVAYVVSVPQAADWLYAERDTHLGLTLAVAAAFWLLYVVAAIGYELRTPTDVAASLVGVAAPRQRRGRGGRRLVADRRRRSPRPARTLAVRPRRRARRARDARARVAHESRDRAAAVRRSPRRLVGVAIAVALDGPAVVAAWSAEALVLAWAGRRTDTPERGLVASLVFAGLALAHVLVFEVPPNSLAYGLALDSRGDRRGRPRPAWRSPGIAAAYREYARAPRLGRRRARRLRGERPGRRIWPARSTSSRRRRRSSRSRASGARSASRRSWPGCPAQAGAAARRPRRSWRSRWARCSSWIWRSSSRSGAWARSSPSACCCSPARSRTSGLVYRRCMSIERLAELLEGRRPCVVLTGAGISTESGIPDFRSAGGHLGAVRPDGGGAHRRVPPRSRAGVGVLRAPARRARRRRAERRAPRARRARGAGLDPRSDHAERRRPAPARRLARGRRGARLAARGRVRPLRSSACRWRTPSPRCRCRRARSAGRS